MIALFDFIPSHCPNCGADLKLKGTVLDSGGKLSYYRDSDYRSGASHSCSCGLHYQHAERNTLLDAAEKHGDMTQYVTRATVAILLVLLLAGTGFAQTPTRTLSLYNAATTPAPGTWATVHRSEVPDGFSRDRALWYAGSVADALTSGYKIETGQAREVGVPRVGGGAMGVAAVSLVLAVLVDFIATRAHKRNPASKTPGRVLRLGGFVRGGLAAWAGTR